MARLDHEQRALLGEILLNAEQGGRRKDVVNGLPLSRTTLTSIYQDIEKTLGVPNMTAAMVLYMRATRTSLRRRVHTTLSTLEAINASGQRLDRSVRGPIKQLIEEAGIAMPAKQFLSFDDLYNLLVEANQQLKALSD